MGSAHHLTASRVLKLEAESLVEGAALLLKEGDSFNKSVELIAALEGKLIVIGVGKSGLVGSKIAATLASTGTASFFLHPTEALHGDLGMVGKKDGVLAISYSGESEELLSIVPHLQEMGVPLIALTKSKNSSLANLADHTLVCAVSQEACPLNAAPTCSTTLTMAIGDALAVALMELRGFQASDFARLHPGGSLGKRLHVQVRSIMRTRHLPQAHEHTPLREAIVLMSAGRLGNLILLNEFGSVSGVLSDGDLRRALLRDDFDLGAPVSLYATRQPLLCETPEMLASSALLLIEERKIQFLVVVDQEKRVLGALHLHDLVEKGISSETAL